MGKIVIANLKMNMTLDEVKNYADSIEGNKSLVIMPTSIYLPYFKDKSYSLGIQDIYFEPMGAYTGEVSGEQASSIGCTYVLVGHSERRLKLSEPDHFINKEVSAALRSNLTPILCIGDTLENKQKGISNEVLKSQITTALAGLTSDEVEKVIIAYEPVWSISTFTQNPEVPTNDDISKSAIFIKEVVKNLHPTVDIRVLYGGSVNASNVEEINNVPEISGVLVGGASLKPDEIMKINEVVLEK